MSTLASPAEPRRMLSREEETDVRQYYATPPPHIAPDPIYLGHIGAHFPMGPRKGSWPAYPDGVEVSEDEAAAQPGEPIPGALLAYQLQAGVSRRSEQAPLMRSFTQDRFYLSRERFEEFQRQRLDRPRRGYESAQSQQSRASTPTQTHEPCHSTFSGHSEYDGSTTDGPPTAHTRFPANSVAFSESHTPSHCSAVTEEDALHKDGVGPSAPYPFSEWDPSRNENVPGDMEIGWTSPGAQEIFSSNAESKHIVHSENSNIHSAS